MKNYNLASNVNLHLKQTKKYKTITIFTNFASEFNLKDKIMKTLLSYMMRERCEKYPSKKDFGRILDLLYGANCRASNSSIGNVFNYSYFGVVLNPLFTDSSIDEFISLYKELLFRPLFTEDNLQDAKKICKLIIQRKVDNPAVFANSETKKLISDNHFANTAITDFSLYENVSLSDIKDYHSKMLNQDKIDIFVYGDLEQLDLLSVFQSFEFKARKVNLLAVERVTNSEFKKQVTHKNISQCNLVMVYETPITNLDDKIGILKAGNIVLGGASTSLLFQSVREEHSLCYSIYSNLYPYEGLLFITTSIDEKNLEKVINLIEENVSNVTNGSYDDNVLKDGISYVVNSIIASEDDLRSSFDFALANSIINKDRKLSELIEQLQNANKESISEVFKSLTLKGMYVLKGEEEVK